MQDHSLLTGLRRPGAYPHPVDEIRVIETHISAVFLTGRFAYKLKKSLDLGFLDFSTLERRRHFCEEELRLNRRLAPQLYLDVLPVTGDPEAPNVGGDGEAIDYMLRMRQFDPEDQLDRLLQRGELDAPLIDRLIPIITRFHEQAAIAPIESDYGRPETLFAPMQQNFDQLRPLIAEPEQKAQLARLEAWSRAQYETLKPHLERRREQGHVRECHGDMHLGNMTLMDSEIAIFDGIEFNDDFRWIDVANELAFFIMDLESRDAHRLARHTLNAWLEATGDYSALAVLRFYQTYRAMVRAKVASIRLGQPGLEDAERTQILADYQRYADLAESYAKQSAPALLITHGFSGSGKTTLSGQLVDEFGAVRIRSDVERKRLHGLSAQARTRSQIGEGLYDPEATERTYEHLHNLAQSILQAGYTVAVDATFLKRAQRDRFESLARELHCPFLILSIQADESTLQARVEQRSDDASEATADVLQHQLRSADPLTPEEPHLDVLGLEPLPIERVRERLGD